MKRAITFLFAALPALVHAQAAFDEGALKAYVSRQVAASGIPVSRFEVQIGTSERAALAPCQRTEPFLPANARPIGRLSLGLRCTDGANWTVMLPLTVRAWGPALVAAGPLAAGSVVAAQDVREDEIEISRESAALLRDPAQAQGRTLVRAVNAGQPLRADMLRMTSVVQAGDPVRLRVVGSGFALSATGQALGTAADGQTVRVRTDFGKVLTGVAREGRIVDLAF